jgi:hypothetical protein
MVKKVPDEVRKQIDQMTEAFRQRLTELFQWSNDEETDHPPTAAEIEDKIREWIRQIGKDTQSLVLGGMDRYRHKGQQCCAIGQVLREQQEAAIRQAWEEYRLPTCEVATPPKRLYVSADGINPRQPQSFPDPSLRIFRISASVNMVLHSPCSCATFRSNGRPTPLPLTTATTLRPTSRTFRYRSAAMPTAPPPSTTR